MKLFYDRRYVKCPQKATECSMIPEKWSLSFVTAILQKTIYSF